MSNDGENEEFVENVIHELAAFHITDGHKESETMNPSENDVRHQDVTSTNGSKSTDNERQLPEASRPNRIIKLSRPANPFTSRSARHSQSDNPSSVNGSTNLSSTTPAPGSRLAALQRPGSPFSKYLQKAQSPALAAASKITRSVAAPGSSSSSKDAAQSNEHLANDPDSLPNGVGDNEHETEQRRSVLPPKTETSTVTRSVLLRRPHSPFNTGQSQLLLNKQASSTVATEPGLTSPNSPLSDGPTSPTLPPRDANPAIEKVAIRNKLRANSFRLKDLLSSRPFVKSKQEGEQGSKDDNSAVRRLSERDRTPSRPEETDAPARRYENEVSTTQRPATDRTRWRVDGSSLPIRPRSRISDRTPTTLISARSLRSRDSDKSQSTGVEQECVVKTTNNNELSKNDECSSSADTYSQINVPNVDANQAMPISYTSDPQTESHVPHTRFSIAATLLRSPRTRNSSASSVPSRQNSEPAEQESTATCNQNQPNIAEEEMYKKTKAISDLDSPNDVNFIFDSETMVQSASSDDSPVNYEQRMTQSLYAGPRQASRQKPRMASEPATPITETQSIQNSKSFENSLDADFAKSSPGLKRSLAVTDLDQAMLDRDQQKLQSMFSREDSSGAKEITNNTSRDRQRSLSSSSQLETDIDVQQGAIHRAGRSPRIKQKAVQSLEETYSPPLSPGIQGGTQGATQTTYKPNVNLEDAVKWPMDVPGMLDFRKMEVFEGQMLLNWLTGSIDKSHYLRLVMTKHDISVIACQICTCLVAAGVIKQLEVKDTETVFKADCMYYWTHSQASPSVQDVNRLPPMWPPTQAESLDTKPGLKYTEADHQSAMVELRHEYNEEVDKLQIEHRRFLDRARQEYETRLQQAVEKIALLHKEVEKYKCLAGIEKLTQAALSDADAARVEAGLLDHHHLLLLNSCSGDHSLDESHSANTSFSDISTPSEVCADGLEEPGVPPPPPPPPPPGFSEGGGPPPPPPAPPPFGSAINRRESMKPVVNPRSPMKPLFWQRIQVHDVKTPRHKEYFDSHLIWEEVKEEEVNVAELEELFSKSVTEPSRRFSPLKHKAKVKQVAKVIAPKRSQTIGILLSSLRMDMSDIEHAILQYDTSILNEEKFRQIYENRGTDEEVKKIKDHLKKHPDICLDKPDQFLYDLSLIPDYAERIFCFIFQQAFQESISVIESKMTNLRMTCQSLLTSVHIKRILGLVLALGNYMNGGNKNRGQADGFGIDILPKLKDVKSKDNSSSLLHYTVIQYIHKFEKDDAGTERVRLPLPDPSDMKQATQVHFDELEKELHRINKDFESAEQRADKVIQAAMTQSSGHLQPFKDTMSMFFEKGRQEFQEQEENLAEGKKMFAETVITFCMKPKHGEKVVTPEYFFSLWATFCQDFKDMWKREQQKIVKLRIKESERRVRKMKEGMVKKPVRTRTRQRGGLKDRLAKQGLLQS